MNRNKQWKEADFRRVKKTLISDKNIRNQEADFRVSLMKEVLKLRKAMDMTQKELEKISGVMQPTIVRLEQGKANPQLSTMLKLLEPFDKTLAIVPIQKEKADCK